MKNKLCEKLNDVFGSIMILLIIVTAILLLLSWIMNKYRKELLELGDLDTYVAFINVLKSCAFLIFASYLIKNYLTAFLTIALTRCATRFNYFRKNLHNCLVRMRI